MLIKYGTNMSKMFQILKTGILKVQFLDVSGTVGIQLSDMSGNWMAISSLVTEWFVIQVTIQLPD